MYRILVHSPTVTIVLCTSGIKDFVYQRAEGELIPEGWLEIDKHYSLELCFSIEKQPETVWRGGCLA